ncbi:hypothetical protein DPMN_170128 [Dreissena polymorpha]|uniref:Uncharacterized protein n=1 Tax=Dreissena polymorpha TaxID=45954 RepID=A0A9D4DXT5_DREPO|nr:hypothetical protein DPMN_170128 [Dreissena polymorpha]
MVIKKDGDSYEYDKDGDDNNNDNNDDNKYEDDGEGELDDDEVERLISIGFVIMMNPISDKNSRQRQ